MIGREGNRSGEGARYLFRCVFGIRAGFGNVQYFSQRLKTGSWSVPEYDRTGTVDEHPALHVIAHAAGKG